MFDIRLSETQRAYRDLAREFAQNEIKPIALDLDKKPNWEDRIPWEVLKKGSKLGFRTFALAEENGGAGASDHLTACLIAEELAAGDIGTAYYYMLTARRARDWFELRMTQAQRDYFLPKFLNDDLFFTTVAIHEPDTDLGFDYFTETPETAKFKTRATEQPDGSWLLNGAKTWCTFAARANVLMLLARTDPATTNHRGLTAFVVDKPRADGHGFRFTQPGGAGTVVRKTTVLSKSMSAVQMKRAPVNASAT